MGLKAAIPFALDKQSSSSPYVSMMATHKAVLRRQEGDDMGWCDARGTG